MLEIKNLSIFSAESRGKLLEGVNLKVEENEIHCILGRNGSGKTTLAYSLMGLGNYKNNDGKIIFYEEDISELPAFERAKKGITLAFQEPARFDGLLVKDFIKAGNKNITEEEIKNIIKTVGVEESLLRRKLDEKLSGGERKRIELASVVAMKPKLMILDEPDASLDIIVYNELYDILLGIKEKFNCSILLITHREEAGLVADKATLLDNGKWIESGSFRHVMRKYCDLTGRRDRCIAGRKRGL
ncbi:MAG: ATP-binding cassette domain-containing protein [Candidatus Moraniibacteriota bacterium]